MSPRRPAPFLHFGHPDSHIPKFELPQVPSSVVPHRRILMVAAGGGVLAFLGQWFHHVGEAAPIPAPGVFWITPFVLLLVGIAVMPFVARRFWEQHYHHVAIGLAALVAIYYIFVLRNAPAAALAGNFFADRAGSALVQRLAEYISFIFLVASLFIVSGGILIRVRRTATPAVNTLFLLSGALLANVLGTTGAAMLLIRPYLHINKAHLRPYHVVFFILLVANIGGCLTPLGPPLFLGYLRGIPFWWFAQACWPMWVIAVGLLLAIFLIIDTLAHRKKQRPPHDPDDVGPPISIYGAANLLLIAAILAGLLLHDSLSQFAPLPWRELIMVAAACVSLWITPHRIHVENVFNFAPIREVAFLFLGIFATMAPALNYLANHVVERGRYLHTPAQNYFASGILSAVLDNAPTYLTFLEVQGSQLNKPGAAQIASLLADPAGLRCLLAISLASVFFGGLTYIGNGPNFMVKSIAQNVGGSTRPDVCPSFFGYIFRYALPILFPILLLIWWMFLR